LTTNSRIWSVANEGASPQNSVSQEPGILSRPNESQSLQQHLAINESAAPITNHQRTIATERHELLR
jgi:hypothetical protein